MHCHYMIPPKKVDFKMMMKHEELLSSCDVLKGGGKTKKKNLNCIIQLNKWLGGCKLQIGGLIGEQHLFQSHVWS